MITWNIAIIRSCITSYNKSPIICLLDGVCPIFTCSAEAFLPFYISWITKFHYPVIIISMITWHIAIIGIRLASDNKSPIICLLDTCRIIFICSTEALFPFNISRITKFHYPIIITSMITWHIAIIRKSIPSYNISTITCLLYRGWYICTISA